MTWRLARMASHRNRSSGTCDRANDRFTCLGTSVVELGRDYLREGLTMYALNLRYLGTYNGYDFAWC